MKLFKLPDGTHIALNKIVSITKCEGTSFCIFCESDNFVCEYPTEQLARDARMELIQAIQEMK